jgi:hypothetical protein
MHLCSLALALLLALGLRGVAPAGNNPGNSVECHFGKCFLLISSTDSSVYLQTMPYDRDRVLHLVSLSSRYMPPTFEIKDVVGDDSPEFVIQTRGGGTGIAETHMSIYGVLGDRIRKLGDFVVAREADPFSDSSYREKLVGWVTFPKKNHLRYRYTQVVTEKGTTKTNSFDQVLAFDKKQFRYAAPKRR